MLAWDKVKVYFIESLADCSGDKNVLTSCQLLRMGWCHWNMTIMLGANWEGNLLLHQTRRMRRSYWLRLRI